MHVRTQVITGLMILIIVLGGAAGCAPPSTQSALPPATQTTVPPATVPALTLQPGWETHSASTDQEGCGYALDHPSDMDAASQGTYSWILSRTATEPSGPVPNFIYISVIPDGFQSSESGVIYNYVPDETQTLLSMQVGESRSLRENLNIDSGFTFTRLPDTALGGQAAQTYENDQPWEFPPGTKEIRYYVKGNGCTYMVGGYMATVGSGQPGSIDEDLFDQIIATFRLAP
jgi:hypothetical protein